MSRSIVNENSLAGEITKTNLIQRMNKLSYEEIRDEFSKIVANKAIYASKETRYKWTGIIAKNKNKNALMFALTNLWLAGDGNGLNLKKH